MWPFRWLWRSRTDQPDAPKAPKAPLLLAEGPFGGFFWYLLWRAIRLGNTQRYIRSCHERSRQKTFRTSGWTQPDTLHVSDRINVKYILERSEKFGRAPGQNTELFHGSWAPLSEGGLLVSNGEEWESYRRAADACVSSRSGPDQVDGLLTIMEPHVKNFLDDALPHDGKPWDYRPDIINWSRDLTLKLILGWDRTIPEKRWASIRKDADYCADIMSRRFQRSPLPRLRF